MQKIKDFYCFGQKLDFEGILSLKKSKIAYNSSFAGRYGLLDETGGCAMKKCCPTLSLVFDFEGLNEVKHPKN